MRIFSSLAEAKNEIARDLNELGVTVFAGYQSKSVENMSDSVRELLTTKELQNYGYMVTRPNPMDLRPSQPWVQAEWAERLMGIEGVPTNPGKAWKLRREVWEPLLESDGAFSYTYSERLARARVLRVVEEMKLHPNTRQAYIPIWMPSDVDRLGKHRVPCSLGYQVMVRNERVHLTYHMRSSDFDTHFDNDVWLALQLQAFFADELGREVGSFTHVLGSLHVYAAKVEHVF